MTDMEQLETLLLKTNLLVMPLSVHECGVSHVSFSSNNLNNKSDDVEHTSGTEMDSPCTLFSSCDEAFNPNELIRQIFDTEELPNGQNVIEDIQSFEWHVETKYYTADIKLCSTNTRTIGNSQFADSVHAVVIYFDSSKKESFELVKAWMPYLKEISPSVQMLVCQSCPHNNVVNRASIMNWCFDNDFELVELNTEEEDDDDEDDDFGETTGIKRIIQALHAHTWPNLIMKDKPDICSPYMKQLMAEQAASKAVQSESESTVNITADTPNPQSNSSDIPDCDSIAHGEHMDVCIENLSIDDKNSPHNNTDINSSGACGVDEKKKIKNASNDKKRKEKREDAIDSLFPTDNLGMIQNLCTEDEEGNESFEQLFANFRSMKEKADSLPPEKRKEYAEKVVVAFWKAIGGDEDEIEGLSDLSEDEAT